MSTLKPWYQVVVPREDLRDNRPLDASEFAVHLDHIREHRAHPDYIDPERFFARTYLTESLLTLTLRKWFAACRGLRWKLRRCSTWLPSLAAGKRTP